MYQSIDIEIDADEIINDADSTVRDIIDDQLGDRIGDEISEAVSNYINEHPEELVKAIVTGFEDKDKMIEVVRKKRDELDTEVRELKARVRELESKVQA
jgi:peptidoglycan hydrolase CwlO-like protein